MKPRVSALAMLAVLALLCVPLLVRAELPPNSIGVFFDTAGTQTSRSVTPFTGFSFYIIANHPEQGITAWEARLGVPTGLTVTSRSLPPGAADFGAGDDNWIVGTGGICYAPDALTVLVTYSALTLTTIHDAPLCLGPANPTTFPDTWGPGYLGCFVPGDLHTFEPADRDCAEQPGCAMINPTGTTPPGCAGVDFALPNVGGGVGSLVEVPVNIFRVQLPKGDLEDLSGVDLTVDWTEGLAHVEAVTLAPLTNGWYLESNAASNQVRISMAGLSGIAVPDAPAPLVNLYFRLTQEGATPLTVTSVRAFDGNRQAIRSSTTPGSLIVGCDKGDPVNDNETNSADAILGLEIAAGEVQPDPIELCSADMNSDGVVSSGDVVLILRRAVGLPKSEVPAPSSVTMDLVAGGVPGEVRLQCSGAAAVEAILTYPSARTRFLRAVDIGSGALVLANDHYPDFLKLVAARATSQDGQLGLQFELGGGGGVVQLLEAVAYDERGVAIPVSIGAAEVDLTVTGASGRTPNVRPAALLPAQPNPFNPSTLLRFVLDRPGDAELSLLDATGRVVRTFRVPNAGAGQHAVPWDGTDDRGAPVASGVYIVHLRANSGTDSGRVTLLK